MAKILECDRCGATERFKEPECEDTGMLPGTREVTVRCGTLTDKADLCGKCRDELHRFMTRPLPRTTGG